MLKAVLPLGVRKLTHLYQSIKQSWRWMHIQKLVPRLSLGTSFTRLCLGYFRSIDSSVDNDRETLLSLSHQWLIYYYLMAIIVPNTTVRHSSVA